MSRKPKTPINLKAVTLVGQNLYLIDQLDGPTEESDHLYVIDLANKRQFEALRDHESLLLYNENGRHNGKNQEEEESDQEAVQRDCLLPVGKWFNHPWLSIQTNGPLKKLSLFRDQTGTNWRQYLFQSGAYALVNNDTRKNVGKEGLELRDYR